MRVLITGANAGIGKAAALKFLQKGHTVFMGSRDMARGEAALRELTEITGSGGAKLIQIDMSSVESIRRGASQIIADGGIDVLINNAAQFDLSVKQPVKSVDGVETVWMTNHIGAALLVRELLPALQRSGDARVISVSSKGLRLQPSKKIRFDDPEYEAGGYSVPSAYYQSKLAQVMYTIHLAKELSGYGIAVYGVEVTNVKIDLTRYKGLSPLQRWVYAVKSKFSITPPKMAGTYCYLAETPRTELSAGAFYNEHNGVVSTSGYSRNAEHIRRLVELTEKYLGRF